MSIFQVSESVVLYPRTPANVTDAGLEVVGNATARPIVKAKSARGAVLVVPAKGTDAQKVALEIVGSSLQITATAEISLVSESVILHHVDLSAERVTLEVVGKYDPIVDPSAIYQMSESVIMTPARIVPAAQVHLEVVVASDYNWVPIVKAKTARGAVLIPQGRAVPSRHNTVEIVARDPTPTEIRKAALEIVAKAIQPFSAKQMGLEVVADSDVVFPSSDQVVAWFTSD